jgi:hypothetical protein
MHQDHDEYEEARRLLAPFASEPTRPSTVDVQRAMADGRRRLRTRRLAGVAAVTALVVAGVPVALAAVRAPLNPPVAAATATPSATPTPTPSPSPESFPVPTASPEPAPEPPTSCELELPPLPADASQSWAFGTDPTGRIVFGKYHQPAGPDLTSITPVLWIDGEAVPLDGAGEDPNIAAVNSSGVAVGSGFVGETEAEIRRVAWIYQDGEVTELAGDDAEPFAITDDGIVVGTVSDRTVPVVWPSPDAPAEQLPTPELTDNWIISEVKPDGTIVGFNNDDLENSFVWWPDGSVQAIPMSKVDGEWFGFRAYALNGHVVVGEAWYDGWFQSSAAYDLATGEYRFLSQDAPLDIWSMNRHGWVVGEADGYAGLWTPEGGLLRLPDLGLHNEYGPNRPTSVTDDGRTITGVVEAAEAEGLSRAAVWRCG